MKKLTAMLLAVMMLVTVFTGCGSFSGTTDGSGAQGDANTLYLYLENEIPTLDPLAASDNIAFNVLNNISEGLYRLDINGEPVPAMASGCEISEDKLTYTFTLREGLQFSNGTPITSKTFKDTWMQQMMADNLNHYAFILTDYIVGAQEYSEGTATAEQVGVETPDDLTLIVKLKAPTPYFLSLTAFVPYYAMDMEFYAQQNGNYASTKDQMVFSGPYVLSEYDPATGVTLVKNPTYWDAENVKTETISIKIIKEQSTALNLYKAGQLSRVKLSSADVPTYQSSEEYQTVTIFRTNFVQFNTTGDATANLNLRKALSYAIDNDTLVNTILSNGAKAANGVVPDFMSSGVEGQTFGTMQGALHTYNPEKAKEYWDLAVAELGAAPTLTLIVDDNTENKDVGTYLQSQFKSTLGIDVQLDAKTKEARRTMMKSSEYQMGLNAWGADYNDPMTYLQLWTENINGFRGNFINDTYADLIAAAKVETDFAKRAEILEQAETYLLDDQAVIVPLYYLGSAYLVKTNVHDLTESNTGVLELKYVTLG